MNKNTEKVVAHLKSLSNQDLLVIRNELKGETIADDAKIRHIVKTFYSEGAFFLQLQEIIYLMLNEMADRFEKLV